MLKNPEAGPSDIVPAMLTPGEAVIPASAAQDPDNIPAIQQMIAEGRMKNRMAEANGVPVNGKEAIMYDEEKLGFAGGNMNIPKGMHMMPDGTLMKDEDHMGYGHGTMEVPAMVMMTPPKDPSMDAMEKMAMQQMGYEMKSKNRTRDTIEKIGLKHLEDTADVNMKQAALDETMRNYNMPVPMPMQPVPQGFQQGTTGLPDPNQRPSLSLGQSLLSGIAGPATGLYDNQTDADLAEISRFGNVIQGDAARRELARRQALVPTGDEIERIDSTAPIKIAGSDKTVTPDPPPVMKTVEDLEEEMRLQEAQNSAPPVPDTPPKKDDGNGEGKGELKGKNEDDDTDPTIFQQLGQGLKEAFDPKAIVKGAVGYGLSSLLTRDPLKAAQTGLSMYSDELGRLDYDEALARSALGSYTPESIEEYKRTGDVSELVALPAAPPGYTSSNREGVYNGEAVPIIKNTETQQEYYSIFENGQQSLVPVQDGQRYGIRPMSDDLYSSPKVTESFSNLGAIFVDQVNNQLDPEDRIMSDPVGTAALADLYLKDIANNNVNPRIQGQYQTEAKAALQDYYRAKAEAGDTFVGSPEAFYNKRKLYLDTVYKDPNTGDQIQRLSYVDIQDAGVEEVQRMVNDLKRQYGDNQFKVQIQEFKRDFDKFKNSNPKYAKELAKAAKAANHSEFTWFVTQAMDGKDLTISNYLAQK